MANKIELLGTDQLLADIRRKLGAASSRLENKALRLAGEPIAAAMQSHVNLSRRKSSHLKADIKVSGIKRDKLKGTRFVTIGATKETSWRGHFLEFGTSNMPTPRPWVQPGFEEGKGEAKQIMGAEFRKALEEG